MAKGKKKASKTESIEVLPPEESPETPTKVNPDNLPYDFAKVPKKSRDLVPYDSLTAYLQEIRRYPRLSREEEHKLAVRFYEHNDLKAAYELVSSNLWLSVKIAREYRKAARSLLDLVQEGNMGLMEAVKNFDPYRGVRFPSYAVWWIRAYIIRFIIANWRMVKIGTTQAQRKLFFNLHKEKEKLERAGFYPETKLLAENLGVKESEVVEMEQRLSGADVSVDAPLQVEDGTADLHAVLSDESPSVEELVSTQQMKEFLAQGFEEFEDRLNEKEALIFRERMLSEEKATLQDLAEKLSLSRERIRQLENKIKDKLKDFLLEKFGESFIEQLHFGEG